MIAVIDVHIQAANISIPLYPWRAFVGSPSSLRVRNVPKKIGTWQITSVDVQVEYPDNTVLRQQTKLVGGVWVATLVGSSSSGMTKNGYTIIASGVDENGDVVSDYILGKGDVEILNADSIVEAGIKVNTVKIFEEQPEEPKDGDMWFNGNQYVIYDKGKITVLGGFEPTEAQQEALDSGITAEKVDSMLDEQDVKNIVLEDTPAYNGWVCTPSELNGNKIEIRYVDYMNAYTPTASDGTVYGRDIVGDYPPTNGQTLRWNVGDWAGETELVAVYQVSEAKNSLGLVTYDYLSENAIPKYEFQKTSESSRIVLKPYTSTNLIINSTSEFTVYVDEDSSNKARECMLVVDANEVVPTITWYDWFHPRTDSATDFVCEAGRNVYWISEYINGQFVVARWLETAGGSVA